MSVKHISCFKTIGEVYIMILDNKHLGTLYETLCLCRLISQTNLSLIKSASALSSCPPVDETSSAKLQTRFSTDNPTLN